MTEGSPGSAAGQPAGRTTKIADDQTAGRIGLCRFPTLRRFIGIRLEIMCLSHYTCSIISEESAVEIGYFMRFSLVDRIVSLEPGKSVTAIKNLTLAEEYLADHFPGFPVMPGVLMVESLVQASAWLMRITEDFKYSTILLKQARAVRFLNFVLPGQTLTVTATVHTRAEDHCVLKGSGTVEGNSVVTARLTLEQFNLSDTNPELAESDRFCIQEMKKLFAQIWSPQMGSSPSDSQPQNENSSAIGK